jgi:hypothetical protein
MADIQIEVDEIVHETDSAVLVKYEGEDVWIPLSQVSRMSRGKQSSAIWIPQWLADKKGFT